MFDVLILGAGVVGSAVARELSRYQFKIGVLEREEDVGAGTSKANSAIIHAGYDATEGSLKARFNVQGNQMMDRLAEELDIPFRRNGSMVLAFSKLERQALEALRLRGEANGVKGLDIIDGDRARALEPALSLEVDSVLVAPSGGIVCPFEMTEAFAENACVNGVRFEFNCRVERIERMKGGYRILSSSGVFETRAVVNCAGLFGDVFHNQLCEDALNILPRRGQYVLLDKKAGKAVSHTLFQVPNALGKGVLVTPTVHGNLLLGPTAEDLSDREDVSTTSEGLGSLTARALKSVPGLNLRQTITSFAGLRAHLDAGTHDFRIGEAEENYFEAVGIESPGLSASPAIGVYLAEMISRKLQAKPKSNFISTRRVVRPREMDFEARQRLIRENPAYGNIICRCEEVSEGEILDAIRRPLSARSLDAVKRRTRAGMGRCQAGFCSVRVMELLKRELGASFCVTKHGAGSEMIFDEMEAR